MANNPLNSAARRENVLALASAIGLGFAEAEKALVASVLITASETDQSATDLAEDLCSLLERTLQTVSRNSDGRFDIEILVGTTQARSIAPHLYVSIHADCVVIDSDSETVASSRRIPRILAALAACYASAAVLSHLLGSLLPQGSSFPLIVNFKELGVDLATLERPVFIGHAYLAGAGAVGNGLLWAARHLDIRGTLDIVDDDTVSAGNLNRQIFFTINDVGLSKAECLARRASPFTPNLHLTPRNFRLQNLPERSEGPWLRKLIVAVDSRRARRDLQNELPGEVYDASTTDIREVVVHCNKQSARGACLSCIYSADEAEYTREQHIAEHLGVTMDEVRTERISEAAASRIVARFGFLSKDGVTGTAYDTLFKQLCAQSLLTSAEGQRVFATFAFVSCLAGTLLALELVRRHSTGPAIVDNYWSVGAWHPPLGTRRRTRSKEGSCSFCGNQTLVAVNRKLWG